MKKNLIFDRIISDVEPELKKEVSLNIRIANRISDLLKEKHISQREFAVKMNKKESEISRWLTGAHGFTTTTLAKMESVLGEPIITVTKKENTNVALFSLNSMFSFLGNRSYNVCIKSENPVCLVNYSCISNGENFS